MHHRPPELDLRASALRRGAAFLAASALLVFTAAARAVAADSPIAPAPFAGGKLSIQSRLRWEYADQDNLRDSNAFTLRTRLGFTSAPFDGWQAMIEGENTAILGPSENYNAAGTNPGGAGRTVIADPPVTDVNQAWLSYTALDATLKGGRQRLVLDNARFVGDSGWRQNMQTFDAATLSAKPGKDVSLFYGYVWRVSRVYGDKPGQPDFKSRSHLLNLSYGGWSAGKLTAYAYLLDFRNSAANSSATYGASFVGAAPVSRDVKLTYRAEYATQHDAGNNPVRYSADYGDAEIGVAVAAWDFGLGCEVLGSDGGGKGFATPLATLHAFDGWADLFLATPARGLRDTFASIGFGAAGTFPTRLVYHDFRSDNGSFDYGREWDAQISHKLGRFWTVLAKAAHYDGKPPYFDTDRLWLQTEFSF
ncbi:MAG TPA: alginate export family protein [Lacunisphaera sp.]|nr:alginate export family protein [Lacunisphaera sp.]